MTVVTKIPTNHRFRKNGISLPYKSTDKTLVARVKAATLQLQEKSKAAKRAKIKGFVEPVPMNSMKTAFKALQIKPYNK